MKLPHSVCEVLRDHVVLESECIDRMYLSVYVPQLQRNLGEADRNWAKISDSKTPESEHWRGFPATFGGGAVDP